jgi:hypothetical protein
MESRTPRRPAVQVDPAAWRPQGFGRGNPKKIVDPIIEPLWPGIRVLVRMGPGGAAGNRSGPRIEIVDQEGLSLDDVAGVADIEVALGAAVRSGDVVIDGYVSGLATRPTEGIALQGPRTPTAADMASQAFLGSAGQGKRRELARQQATAAATAGPLAFVAIDLLLLDGEPLLDIPLLERKRILEGVVEEGPLIRRTAFVRPPIDPWLGTWRSMGFGSMAYKGANSRYVPGARNPAWASVRIPSH